MPPVSFSWKEHRVDAQNQAKQVNLIYYCLVSWYQFLRIQCLNMLIKIKVYFHQNIILRSSLNRLNTICSNNSNILKLLPQRICNYLNVNHKWKSKLEEKNYESAGNQWWTNKHFSTRQKGKKLSWLHWKNRLFLDSFYKFIY